MLRRDMRWRLNDATPKPEVVAQGSEILPIIGGYSGG
jgi:hypothetical protein